MLCQSSPSLAELAPHCTFPTALPVCSAVANKCALRHPEKQKQTALHPPTDPGGPWLIKALGIHRPAQCAEFWSLSESSWEGSDSTPALSSNIASSSQDPIFFPGAVRPTLESASSGDATQGECSSKNNRDYVKLSFQCSLVAACDHWDKFSGDRRMQAS